MSEAMYSKYLRISSNRKCIFWPFFGSKTPFLVKFDDFFFAVSQILAIWPQQPTLFKVQSIFSRFLQQFSFKKPKNLKKIVFGEKPHGLENFQFFFIFPFLATRHSNQAFKPVPKKFQSAFSAIFPFSVFYSPLWRVWVKRVNIILRES